MSQQKRILIVAVVLIVLLGSLAAAINMNVSQISNHNKNVISSVQTNSLTKDLVDSTHAPLNKTCPVMRTNHNTTTQLDGRTGNSQPQLQIGAITYGYVKYSLFVQNDTLFEGNPGFNGNTSSGSLTGVAYDSANGNIYVGGTDNTYYSNGGSGMVYEINTATNKVVSNVSLGILDGIPGGLAYDSANGYLYVAVYPLYISVVNTADNSIVTTIEISDGGVGSLPNDIVYDPVNNCVYALGLYNGENVVFVIDTSTNTISDYFVAGMGENGGLAFDSANNDLYLPYVVASGNQTTGYIQVVSTLTYSLSATINIEGLPSEGAITFCPSNGYLYIPCYSSGNKDFVAVIDGRTNTILRNITAPFGELFMCYDPSNGYIYDAGTGSPYLTVIDTSNDTVIESVEVGGNYGGPISGGAYSSSSNYLYFANGYDFVSIIAQAPTFSVSFNETGLPAGTDWSVLFNGTRFNGQHFQGTKGSNSSSILFPNEPNGTFWYRVSPVQGYITEPGSGGINVSGASQWVDIYFARPTYNITFTEYGLPPGKQWSMTLNGTSRSATSSSISFSKPDGNYTAYVGIVPNYKASPSSVNVTVDGNSLVFYITFSLTLVEYSVTFTESGLPIGTDWSVTLNGSGNYSTSNSISFSEPNGTYSYTVGVVSGYSPLISGGSVTVNGAATAVSITFAPSSVKTYSVTFSETDLPSGTMWSTTLNGSTESSSLSTISFSEPNGSYSYSVGTVSGYLSSPSSGTVTVSGSQISVSITFTSTVSKSYSVTFTESGLPLGTSWSVTMSNSSRSGLGRVIGTINTTNELIEVFGLAYDTSNNYLYGVGYGPSANLSDNQGEVVVINAASNNIVTTIPIGSYLVQDVYDPSNGYIYVTDDVSNDVFVIDTTSNSVVATIAVGNGPVFLAYDSLNHDIYVSNFNSSSLSVISGVTNKVLTTIHLGPPGTFATGVVYDPSNSDIYVGVVNNATLQGSIYVISDSTESIVTEISGIGEFGTYSTSNGYLYFTNPFSSSVLVINGATNGAVKSVSLPYNASPYGITYDSGLNYVCVADGNTSQLSIISPTSNTLIGEINVTHPFSVTYDPANQYIYGSFASFSMGFGVQIISLHSGGNSTTKSSLSSTIRFTEPNGTYDFRLGNVSKYSSSPSSGNITVSGAGINERIFFTPVSVQTYNVTFTESGLPIGTIWYLNITGQPSSGPIAVSSYSISLANGTYGFSPSQEENYFVANGSFTLSGKSTAVEITYDRFALLEISLQPSSANLSINGKSANAENGFFQEYVKEGYYYVNATASGYTGYSNLVYLSWNETYEHSIALKKISEYGYLSGTVIPENATVLANGVPIPVISGYFNASLEQGTYYISVTAHGYQGYVTTVSVSVNRTASLTIVLERTSSSITVSGYVVPSDASVTVNGFVAYVNSTGFYRVSVPSGNVTLSAYLEGYFSYSARLNLKSSREINITLVKEQQATSSESSNGTSATGYDVSISNITTGTGIISVSYNTTSNGTLVVTLPERDIINATIADLLSSRVFIDGVQYKNFTITITSNGSAILTVYGLSGDPTIYWQYSPLGKIPSYYSVEITESGLLPGTTWYVDLSNGQKLSSVGSTITFSEENGSYSFVVQNVSGYILTQSTGQATVNGGPVTESIVFTHFVYLTGTIAPTNATLLVNQKSVKTENGDFNVTLTSGTYEIEVRATGYSTFFKNVTVSGNTSRLTPLTITLQKERSTAPFPLLIVIVLIVMIAIIVAAVALVMRSRSKKP